MDTNPELLEHLKKISAESAQVEVDILEMLKTKHPEATVQGIVMPLITLAVLLLARNGFTPQQTLHFLEAGFTSASMRAAFESKQTES